MDDHNILNSIKAMKSKIFQSSNCSLVKIDWTYGGEEVYITGSFTNWDYMIKMTPLNEDGNKIHQISMVSINEFFTMIQTYISHIPFPLIYMR